MSSSLKGPTPPKHYTQHVFFWLPFVILFLIILTIVILYFKYGHNLFVMMSYLMGMIKRQLIKTVTGISPPVPGVLPFVQEDTTMLTNIRQLYHYHDLQWKGLSVPLPLFCPYMTYKKNKDTDPPVVGFYHVPDTDHCYIILRGTKTIPEAMLDLKIGQQYHDGIGMIHSGFSELLVQLMDHLLAHRDTLIKFLRGKHVHIFGHSLGGAMAVLITCFLAQKQLHPFEYQSLQCIHSGSPRVLSVNAHQHFVTTVQKHQVKVTTILNHTDIIPSIPLAVTDLGNHTTFYYKPVLLGLIQFNVVQKNFNLVDCHNSHIYAQALTYIDDHVPNVGGTS